MYYKEVKEQKGSMSEFLEHWENHFENFSAWRKHWLCFCGFRPQKSCGYATNCDVKFIRSWERLMLMRI